MTGPSTTSAPRWRSSSACSCARRCAVTPTTKPSSGPSGPPEFTRAPYEANCCRFVSGTQPARNRPRYGRVATRSPRRVHAMSGSPPTRDTVATSGPWARVPMLGMKLSRLRTAGHAPSLVAALLHFDVSFMVWVLLGALGPIVAKDLHLTTTQKALMVALPPL